MRQHMLAASALYDQVILCGSPSISSVPVPVQSDALKPLAKEWVTQIPMGRLAEVTDLEVRITITADWDFVCYLACVAGCMLCSQVHVQMPILWCPAQPHHKYPAIFALSMAAWRPRIHPRERLSLCQQTPLEAVLDAVQAAIVFMASDASAFMTGHNLALTGGHTLW